MSSQERIAYAIGTLREFCDEPNRYQAEMLLRMWRHRGTLTHRERTETLKAFPSAPTAPRPGGAV